MDWGQMITQPRVNLFEVEKSVQDWIAQHPNEKPPKPMLRWIEKMRGYADQDGFIDRSKEVQASQDAVRLRQQSSRAGNWTHLGPKNTQNLFGIGRVNSITFHPTDSLTLFAGTPGGGLFKSTDYGLNWLPLTDELPSLGVSDMVIHPTHPDTMFMATGDNDAQDTPCFGILKSTDGGQNWSNVFPISASGFFVDELIIHPTSPDTLLAATSRGIYRTADGGQNWNRVETGNYEDIEFHPTNPNIVYAVGYGGSSGFRKSTDNGVTWSGGASGLPIGGGVASNLGRMMMAVTADEPDYVYVLVARNNAGDFDFHGLYRSTNSAQSFTARNLDASAFRFRQAWYDLALNVSPWNADEVFMGDFPLYRSLDGGTNWVERTNRLHVDFHDIEYHPKTRDLWIASDGGMYLAPNQNPGNTFDFRSNGLHATQFYRLGTSVHDGTVLAGAQDNGTMERGPGGWTNIFGADGMECLVSWEDPDFQVLSWQNGQIVRRIQGNPGGWLNPNITNESGAWTTPFIQDPNNSKTYYAGFQNIWITENAGTWRNLTGASGVLGGSTLHKLLVPQRSQGFYIYAATRGALFQSLDKGVSWKQFTFNGGQGTFQDITSNSLNPQTLYGAFNNGVFISTDAGETWTDMSDGLPAGLPVQAIVYQNGSGDALYAGTSVGVYYRDSSMTSWAPFMDGLPNVEIAELEISYCEGKIRAATYGRGVWESDLYNNGYQELTAEITIDYTPTGSRVEAKASGGFAPYSYLWNTGNPMPMLNNPTPQTYTVTITDKNHCSVKDTIVVNATAIENQFDDLTELEIFPNPAKDVLNLRFQTNISETMNISLSNTLGQKLKSLQYSLTPGSNRVTLSIGDLPSGLYLLDLEMKGEKMQTKLIKQ